MLILGAGQVWLYIMSQEQRREVSDQAFGTGSRAVRRIVEWRLAIGAHDIACIGFAADGSATVHACGGRQPRSFGQCGVTDRQAVSAGGLERALFDAARPGKAPALDQRQSLKIIAVVCSPPPEGEWALDGAAAYRRGDQT